MTTRPSERLAWAAQVVAPRPGDRILEVGCGQGVLVALLCLPLTTGRVVGLDRSAKITEVASRMNEHFVRTGRAELHTGRIQGLQAEPGSFDVVLAFRVREMWTDPVALPRVRESLEPGGRILLFLDAPSGAVPDSTVRAVAGALESHAFVEVGATSAMLPSGAVTCVSGRAPGHRT